MSIAECVLHPRGRNPSRLNWILERIVRRDGMRSLVTTQQEMRPQTEPETARPQTTRAPEPPHGQPAPHTTLLPDAILPEAPPEAARERPWLDHYPACVPKTLKYPAVPTWGLLAHSACEFPERTACIHLGRRTTYAELAEKARRTASMLVRLGVRPGDRVGLLLPNTPEFLSAVNGIWMAGAAAVAISPLSVAEEVSALVAATGCKTAISLDVLAPLLWDGPTQPETVILTTLQDRLPVWQRPLYWFARQRRFLRSAARPARPCVVAREGAGPLGRELRADRPRNRG